MVVHCVVIFQLYILFHSKLAAIRAPNNLLEVHVYYRPSPFNNASITSKLTIFRSVTICWCCPCKLSTNVSPICNFLCVISIKWSMAVLWIDFWIRSNFLQQIVQSRKTGFDTVNMYHHSCCYSNKEFQLFWSPSSSSNSQS